MKVIAINGSPRKKGNTATLLEEAVKGAQEAGAQTEMIHLYDLDYKGCSSCLACKLKGGKSHGHCAQKDDLQPVLQKIEEADALLIGSPIYLGNVTGETRSFLERLVFQYLEYTAPISSMNQKDIPVGIIYTFGAPDDSMREQGFDKAAKSVDDLVQGFVGPVESIFVTDTLLFEEFSKYEHGLFDPEIKLKTKNDVFPQDCRKAYELGARLAKAE